MLSLWVICLFELLWVMRFMILCLCGDSEFSGLSGGVVVVEMVLVLCWKVVVSLFVIFGLKLEMLWVVCLMVWVSFWLLVVFNR